MGFGSPGKTYAPGLATTFPGRADYFIAKRRVVGENIVARFGECGSEFCLKFSRVVFQLYDPAEGLGKNLDTTLDKNLKYTWKTHVKNLEKT